MAGDRHHDPDDDTTLPQEPALAELAHQGELAAAGLPAYSVRRLGTRRRRRRHAAVGAGALALVLLAGGIAVGSTGTLLTQDPPVVATPTPAPTTVATSEPSTAGRTLTETQLLRVGDVPVESDTQRVAVAPGDELHDLAYVCVPAGDDLREAPTVMGRDFRYVVDDPEFSPDPDDPSTGKPVYYTQAMQFADADAAAAAEQRYAGWLDDCRTTLAAKGFTLIGGGAPTVWTDVTVDRSSSQAGTRVGRFATVTTFREPDDSSENGWFASVGLTQVDDRLMITVRLVYGMDDNGYSLRQGGDPDTGLPQSPQFALVLAAVERLGG